MLERENGFLGDEEFVDATIHRLGEHIPKGTPKPKPAIDAVALLAAIEEAFEVSRSEICGPRKAARIVHAKETLVLCGNRLGANLAELSRLTGLNSSTIARRLESAQRSHQEDKLRQESLSKAMALYETARIARSHD